MSTGRDEQAPEDAESPQTNAISSELLQRFAALDAAEWERAQAAVPSRVRWRVRTLARSVSVIDPDPDDRMHEQQAVDDP